MKNPLSVDLRRQLVVDDEYSAFSNKYTDWRCEQGHIWTAQVSQRSRGRGCPICMIPKRTAKTNQTKLTNNPLPVNLQNELVDKALKLSRGSRVSVEWKCSKCNHIWHQTPNNRTANKSGCPRCPSANKTSKGEGELQEFVSNLGYEIICNDRKIIKPLELDIYIPSLNAAIEYNGVYWHSQSKAMERDKRKNQMCKDLGIRLLTITDKQWHDSTSNDVVKRWLESL